MAEVEARVQLQKALELNPIPLTQTYLGEVEAALGNQGEALRLLQSAYGRAAQCGRSTGDTQRAEVRDVWNEVYPVRSTPRR